MLYTLIVVARFWVRELGGAGPGTVAGAVAGAGAGAGWCCLKRAFLS